MNGRTAARTRGSLELFRNILLLGISLGSCKLSGKHMNETILQVLLFTAIHKLGARNEQEFSNAYTMHSFDSHYAYLGPDVGFGATEIAFTARLVAIAVSHLDSRIGNLVVFFGRMPIKRTLGRKLATHVFQ